ncbi:cobalamin-binding protein [Shewanella psychromarinicola]|uniref:cobalamin-binding protein n=1 Tax=Shewanella psychromarinicola TaxID=2487742 RepID=UPI0035561700
MLLRLFLSLSIVIGLLSVSLILPAAELTSVQAQQQKLPAKRIIALSPHGVEMLFAIGAGESILATTDYADYPAAAKDIPRIGGYYGIQIERVIELNPDLVIVWQSGNKQGDINQLRDLGFSLFNSDPKNLADVATDLEALGKLTGHQAQAQQVATDYRQQLAQIRLKNQAKPAVKVFYQLWSTPLMTVAKGSWIQHLIEVCHGENVFYDAASEYPQISIENVLLTGAEVILQSQDEGNVLGINWADWPELPAVKNQHIYQFDADLLHRATPRAIQGVNAVCGALDKVRG